MQDHDNVELFVVHKSMRLPIIYKELSSIIVIDLESELPLIMSKDPWRENWWDMIFLLMLKHTKWFRFLMLQVFLFVRVNLNFEYAPWSFSQAIH